MCYFEPRRNGKKADKVIDPIKMEKAKLYYYSLLGWDTSGVPTAERIEELSIT
jgi:aldehyde:ferredoxin oxidoreductase